MIVKKALEQPGVLFAGGVSYRPIVAADGLGFSVHKTVIPKGPANRWHYKHHLEACYCVQGRGILTALSTGETWLIEVDTCYALNNHDNHTFEALEDVVLISVFNPPVVGNETHREDGSYEPAKNTHERDN